MSKKLIFALVAALAASLAAAVVAAGAVTAGNTGWSWGNPLPQGNNLASLDAIGARVYAGGATGTLLKSSDSGATWSTVRTGLLDDIQKVRAITPDSFVFAGSCALRRSDDGGVTITRLPWTADDASCSPTIKSFYFPSLNTGYLLLSNGNVYATADGGQSWTNSHTAVPGTSIVGGPDAPGDIWFLSDTVGVVDAGSTIYRTTDGGNSWTPVGSTPSGALRGFTFVNSTDGYVVGQNRTVMKTTDGGLTWTAVPVNAGPTPASGSGSDLQTINCVDGDASTCIVSLTSGGQLLRTTDGGTNWTAVTPSTRGIFDAGFASPTRAIGVGGIGTTVISDDAGSTWRPVSSAASGAYRGLRAQSASTAFAFGDAGALARTTNGGASWSSVGVNTSAAILDVAFPTPQTGFVLDAKGTLLRTANGGGSWQFIDTGTTAKALALAAPTASTVILVGPKGIHRSTNGGNDFALASGKKLKTTKLTSLDYAGSALVAYSSKAIFISKNTGKLWVSLKHPPKAKSMVHVDMVSAKAGYVQDSKGELWKTTTGGKKWTRIESTGTAFIQTMTFGDINHGYLTDGTGRILYTADGGKSWSRQYPFFDAKGLSRTVIDAPSGANAFALIAGTNELFGTASGGTFGGSAVSNLTIKPSAAKVKANAKIAIKGKLSPAQGGEHVTVLARSVGAKNGTIWSSQDAIVSSNGTFTTDWKIKRATIFVARWSGDYAHDGDGTTATIVKIKSKKKSAKKK